MYQKYGHVLMVIPKEMIEEMYLGLYDENGHDDEEDAVWVLVLEMMVVIVMDVDEGCC